MSYLTEIVSLIFLKSSTCINTYFEHCSIHNKIVVTINFQVLLTRIKTERKNKRRRSPAAAESSGSEDSSSSELSAVVQSTRLTLSERFGKMAQWSVDRRDIENMRITKNSNSGDLKVMIEAEERMYDSPPLRYR